MFRKNFQKPTAERKYAISGLFLTRPTTGMERYAYEVTDRLDRMVDPELETIYLIVPIGTSVDRSYANIRVVEKGHLWGGNLGGYLWEQTWFAKFLLETGAEGYLPLSFVPALHPDVVVTIHDGTPLSHPEFFPTAKKKLYRFFAAQLLRVARKRTRRILTVSEASRSELVGECGFDGRYINVAKLGLEHIPTSYSTDSVDVPSRFYFALSSATYNKNFEWVLATAAQNPGLNFVVAGIGDIKTIARSQHFKTPPTNVRHLGYVTDEQRNWLYANCAAFLFPSRYEGFGLPPLEAACFGAPLVIADIAPMREVFGDNFVYLDPDTPATDLESITNIPDLAALRSKYTWERPAAAILAALRQPLLTPESGTGTGSDGVTLT